MIASAVRCAFASLTTAPGTSVASVVAESTDTTPWSSSRLITTWPPKTGTPSTTWSARTMEPPVAESRVCLTTARDSAAVDAEGVAVARELLLRRTARGGAASSPSSIARAVGRADEVDAAVVCAVDPHPAHCVGAQPVEAVLGVRGAPGRGTVAGRGHSARPRLPPPAERPGRSREHPPAWSMRRFIGFPRAVCAKSRADIAQIRQTGKPAPGSARRCSRDLRAGPGSPVRRTTRGRRAAPARTDRCRRCRRERRAPARIGIAESMVSAVDSGSSMRSSTSATSDHPAGRVLLGEQRERGVRGGHQGGVLPLLLVGLGPGRAQPRGDRVGMDRCRPDAALLGEPRQRARGSRNVDAGAHGVGHSPVPVVGSGSVGLRLHDRLATAAGARTRVSLALSTSSSSASRTHWASTSMSGRASRSALMP